MILLFHHGWAFDSAIWRDVIAALPGFDCRVVDRGYFGPALEPRVEGECILVAHSFGTCRAIEAMPEGALGLVAINGFDRFASDGDGPGVPRRAFGRMIAQCRADPASFVGDFRKRSGSEGPMPEPVGDRLLADFIALRDADMRKTAQGLRIPVLALEGGRDPILSEAMREAALSSVPQIEKKVVPDAGHLLPVSDPLYCAGEIRNFANRMG